MTVQTLTKDPLIGQQLDEYRLEALLGHGGMARVYRGQDVRLRRYVAIKVIDAPFRAESEYTARFEREAQAIAQLEHPHIVRLYRYGEVDNMLYMAMQYIEGVDLQTMLSGYEEKGELMAPEDVRRIIGEVCLALDYAHSKGVIHRDMKPANVMIDASGQAFIADFGLALMTEMGTQGEIFGTPQYIAPEQAISSAGAVPQSDLYAVGVMLYRMFTGVLPFTATDPLEVAMWHVTESPPPPHEKRPSISPQLDALILKSLAKEPQARYPTGATLLQALDEALTVSSSELATAAPTLSILERVSLQGETLPPLPAALTA
jgi:serine/threonine protein kinase